MEILCEGSLERPSKVMIDGNEISVDTNKWEKAYKTIKEDMGLDENAPDFLDAVYEIYASL